jgi:hypothetical protein
MFWKSTRKITLVLTLAVLAAPVGRAVAQSSTPPPTPSTGTSTTSPGSSTDPGSGVVTGTDPEPDYLGIVLMLMGLA